MKLKEEFIAHDAGTESLLVPTGAAGWAGVVRGNKTLGAILGLLQGETTQEQEAMLGYMADSGAYGTMAHNVGNQLARYGRAGYLVRRAFPPIQTMRTLYPVLARIPALLPACWVWRLVSAVATKPKKVGYQLGAVFRRSL